MTASHRSFVRRHTRLRPVPGLGGLRLLLADDIWSVWRALQVETGDADSEVPFWAVAWGGGLAIARLLVDHPETVQGRRVFDLASGSGLCAIASASQGAVRVEANDVDPFAVAAIVANARANGCRIDVIGRDVLDDGPPDVDVILAGDCWYRAELAHRVLPWLRRARDAGIDVLVGDPGRDHLPTSELIDVASYDVRTTTELEDLRFTQARVYRLAPSNAAPALDDGWSGRGGGTRTHDLVLPKHVR